MDCGHGHWPTTVAGESRDRASALWCLNWVYFRNYGKLDRRGTASFRIVKINKSKKNTQDRCGMARREARGPCAKRKTRLEGVPPRRKKLVPVRCALNVSIALGPRGGASQRAPPPTGGEGAYSSGLEWGGGANHAIPFKNYYANCFMFYVSPGAL